MLITILILIYPLKAIFGAMWYFLSDGQMGRPFSRHTTEAQARTIFAIYALGLIAISAEILLLYLRAWQLREPLRLNARERLVTRGELGGWCIPVGVGIVSLVLALSYQLTGSIGPAGSISQWPFLSRSTRCVADEVLPQSQRRPKDTEELS